MDQKKKDPDIEALVKRILALKPESRRGLLPSWRR